MPPLIKYILLFIFCLTICYSQIVPTENVQNTTKLHITLQKNTVDEIYGVRWFLGDYFAYSNLYKTHATYPNRSTTPLNTNYYILAFNSQKKFEGDVYVEILSSAHTCSHRKIEVNLTNNHDPLVQIKPNDTSNATISHIYRCYINVDLSKFWQQAKRQGTIPNKKENQSIWKEYPYQIYTQKPEFMYKQENNQPQILNRKIKTNKVILFEGNFRSPIPVISKNKSTDEKLKQNEKIFQNVLVLGDWGIITQQTQKTKQNYIPIIESLLAKMEEDTSIVLVLFLGDIGYDIVGQKYKDILRYLQPLLSRMCFMATPGNHDYIYHEDSFELFAETFLSPEWSKYYDFYYTFILGDVLFINYVPENVVYGDDNITNVKPLDFMREDLYNHYLKRVGNANDQNKSNLNRQVQPIVGSPDPIYKQYHVIVFSHYPIFCSKFNDHLQSCQQNRYRLKQYLQVFTDIGMDLYLTGHVHYYERTHEICWDTSKLQYSLSKSKQQEGTYEIYKDKCFIQVVEGAAGNDYFEESDNAIAPTQITSKIAFGTGFGVLSIISQSQIEFKYTHFKMLGINKTQIVDQFIKKLPKLSQFQKDFNAQNSVYIDRDLINARVMEMLGILLLIFIGSVVCFCYGRFYVKNFGQKSMNKKKFGDHEQMVEENLNSVISQGQNANMEKKIGTEDEEIK